MPASWSARLEEQFGIALPDDLRAWFDDELWENSDSTLYNEPVSPHDLLDPRSYSIWGGQMPPDTLPVLGNGFGDCLSLRFDAQGGVAEVICWQHEGGQWWPFSKTLAETLVFDRLRTLTARPDSEYFSDDEVGSHSGSFAEWGAQWVPGDLRQAIGSRETFDNPRGVYGRLLDAGVAEDCVHGTLCEQALSSGLLGYCCRVGGQNLANRLGVPWSQMRLWLFDNARVPPEIVDRLAKETGMAPEALLCQDWQAAADHARRVTERRKDLAWPFAVVGWAKERNGNIAGAVEEYFSGLRALGSTAAFTDDWDLADAPSGRKFAAARLIALRESLPPAVREDPYLHAVLEQHDHPRERACAIREFWLAAADDASKGGDGLNAYRSVYAAGWDAFCTDEMDAILDRLIAAAQLAGTRAWEKLAERHRQSI